MAWRSARPDLVRPAHADRSRPVEPTRIAVINRHTFLFLVHETPTFALDVMRSLAERILSHDRQR